MSPLSVSLWFVQFAADFTEVALVWLVQSTVILLVALAASRILVSRGPALHSAIYRTALVVVMVCPVGALLFSAWGEAFGWRLPAIEVIAVAGNETVSETGTDRAGTPIGETRPALIRRANQPDELHARARAGTSDLDRLPAETVNDAELAPAPFWDAEPHSPLITVANERASAMEDSFAVAGVDGVEVAVRVRTGVSVAVVAVACLWLGASLMLFGRLLAGLRASGRLVRQAVPVDADEQELCRELAETIGVRPPRLARSAFVDSPCLVGVARPAILLPEGAPGVPLEAVLVHELAHLRRGDHVWNLAARSALCAGFAQPLLWTLVRRMETAAEEVCDDHVVHFGADRTRYADGLVTLAEQSALPLPGMSVPLVTLRSLLARRVRRILDYQGSRFLRIGKPAFCALFVVGVLGAVLSGFVGTPDNAGAVAADQERAERAGAPTKTATSAEQTDPLALGAIARLGTTRFRPTRTLLGVSFLPDGRTLIQTNSDGRLEYWDAESGRFLRSVPLTHRRISAAHHSANGRFIALREYELNEERQINSHWATLFDAATGRSLASLPLENVHGQRIFVSPDGSILATDGKQISILDASAKTEVARQPLKRQIHSLAISPTTKFLAAGGEGNILLWEWSGNGEPITIPMPSDSRRTNMSVLSTAFTADGRYLAAGADSFPGIILLDINTGKEVRRFQVEGIRFWYPRSLAFSIDGKMLAAPIERNDGGGVAVWEVESGKLLKRLVVPHQDVSDIAFSPDGRLLAGTSDWSPLMCVWNLSTGERLGGDLSGHVASPSGLRFVPGDRRLVTTGDDGTMRVWSVDDSKQERVITHNGDSNSRRISWIRAIDVSPDGKLFASSSLDDTVRIWETDTGKELYKLPGHGQRGGRRALRFTPDGRQLVSWGDDMRVYVWDVRTGKAVLDYQAQPSGAKLPADGAVPDPFGGREGVFRLEGGVFSPDASRLLVRGDQIHLFEVATGKEIAKYERTVGSHTGLAVSPDNQYTVALSVGPGREIPLQGGGAVFTRLRDHVVQLRKLTNGAVVNELKLPDGGIGVAAFSPDSRQVAITINDKKPHVLILSVPELKEVARIEGLPGRAHAVEFSGSGKRLAVSNADTTVVVYDLEEVGALEKQSAAAATSPSSPTATKSNDRQRHPQSPAATHSVRDEAPALPVGAVARMGTTRFRPPHAAEAVSFLPDGRTLALTTLDGRLEHWDAQSGRFLHDVRFAEPHVPEAAYTSDGRFVVARGWINLKAGQKPVYWVALLDAQTGQEKMRQVLQMAYSGDHVVVADNASAIAVDGEKLMVIDVAKNDVIGWPLERVGSTTLALSPDGDLLAVGSPNLVRVWRWKESQEPRSFVVRRKDPRVQAHVNSLRFSPNGSLLAIGDHVEGIRLMDLRSGDELHRLAMDDVDSWRAHHLVFSPNGQLLATPIESYEGGGVALWNVAQGNFVKRLEMPYGGVRHIAFSPDGNFLAGTDPFDSTLCVWNVESGELLGADLAGHRTPANTIHFLPGDDRLASAGDDSTVHVWNVTTGELERVMTHPPLSGYHRMLRAMAISPDGKFVASSCLDDTVRLWEADTGDVIYRLPGHGDQGGKRSLRFTPDSRRLVSWGDDMRVYVWDVRTGKAMEEYQVQATGVVAADDGARIGRGTPGDGLWLEAGIFSRDASRLVVVSKTMHVFDVATGREMAKFDRMLRSRVTKLAISPDNRYLLMYSTDYGEVVPTVEGKTSRHRAELRQLADGKLVGQLNREDGGWSIAAFSPDSRRAAITVGNADPYVAIVTIPELTEISRIEGLRALPRAAEFSHSGNLLALSNPDTTIVVYDLEKLAIREPKPTNRE